MNAITVEQLILLLQKMSPEAHVEYELPRVDTADEGILHTGDRCMVEEARETFYNERDNKWVVLS